MIILRNGTKRLPEGVQDIHSIDLELKENLTSKLKTLYRSYGYRQVQTPTFEYYDLFLEINGTIDREKMVKLVDRDGKILVLRPDATIPIARMVATFNKDEDSYYKLSYFTSVFRMNDDKQSITNRELTQAGIELFGKNHMEADVEVITLAIKSMESLGLQHFKIDLGQANYFKELLYESKLPPGQLQEIQKRIEQKNVSELKQILKDTTIDEKVKKVLLSIPLLYGDPANVIEKARELALNDKMREELAYLEEVYERLVETGYGDYLSLDLGMINDLNYYTGIIFQGYIKNHGKPIVIGGRYDQLTKQFGSALPATGFGFYLDDVLEVTKGNGIRSRENVTNVMVCFTKENRKKGLALADELREKGNIVESDIIDDESQLDRLIDKAKSREVSKIIVLKNRLTELIEDEKVSILDDVTELFNRGI